MYVFSKKERKKECKVWAVQLASILGPNEASGGKALIRKHNRSANWGNILQRMQMKKFCRDSSDAQDKTGETTTGCDTNALPVKSDMMLHSHSLTQASVIWGFCWLHSAGWQRSTAQIWVMGWNYERWGRKGTEPLHNQLLSLSRKRSVRSASGAW